MFVIFRAQVLLNGLHHTLSMSGYTCDLFTGITIGTNSPEGNLSGSRSRSSLQRPTSLPRPFLRQLSLTQATGEAAG